MEIADAGIKVFWLDQFSDGYNGVRLGGFPRAPTSPLPLTRQYLSSARMRLECGASIPMEHRVLE